MEDGVSKWVLLKSLGGTDTFHGVVLTDAESTAWDRGSAENWSWPVDEEESVVVSFLPITRDED
jgi:hypothetical protein